jgi:DNA-binding LytR/AlgR family response regulator
MAVTAIGDVSWDYQSLIPPLASGYLGTPGMRIDLVFTDIDMPGGPSGLELAAFSRARSVTVGILVTSGRMVVQPDQMPDRARFLAKPYSRAELVETLQALLG